LPNFGFDKALDVAQEVKALLKSESGDSHENSKNALLRVVEYRRKLSIKKRQASQIRRDLRAATSGVERSEHKKNKKRVQQEILQLQIKLGVAKRGSGDQETGALPGFLVIGAKKPVPPIPTGSSVSTRSSSPQPPRSRTSSTSSTRRGSGGTVSASQSPGKRMGRLS